MDEPQTYKVVFISCQTDNEIGLEALKAAYDVETLKGRIAISHDLYNKSLTSTVTEVQAAIISAANRYKISIATEFLCVNHVGINAKMEIDLYLAYAMGKRVKFSQDMEPMKLSEIIQRAEQKLMNTG